MNLQGKTALVTGGAVRVGRALTLALARSGANVVVHYNSSVGPAEETAAEARALGVAALTVQADIGDPKAIAGLVRAVEATSGGIDILVNSASPFIRGQLHDTTLEQWHFVLRALLDGPFLLCQAFAPGMIERGNTACWDSPAAWLSSWDLPCASTPSHRDRCCRHRDTHPNKTTASRRAHSCNGGDRPTMW
jgi:NAD(P)-dependent dehydrogenase (short-subunit alcohol dehydrogenase family)